MPHPVPSAELPALDRLRAVVHCLRAPGGCPWDREQTHASLVPHLIEEAYEVAEAIRTGQPDLIKDELGDLLLQPVLHAEIASETGVFDLDAVAANLTEKLIRRHPHVFGEAEAANAEAVLVHWDAIKQKEKGQAAQPLLEAVGEGLPSLMRAQKLQKKAAKVGFDWQDIEPVFGKIREETAELEEAVKKGHAASRSEHELGDLLFSVVNLSRKLGVDAESALAAANERFASRFGFVERKLQGLGKSLETASLAEMDEAWEEAKRLEEA